MNYINSKWGLSIFNWGRTLDMRRLSRKLSKNETPKPPGKLRTREYSVNENSLIGKFYKWSEDETEKIKAKPAV